MATPRVPPEKRKKTGRPTLYDPARHPTLAKALARDGATVEGIAQALGVSLALCKQWAQRHPAFLAATRSSRDDFDERVETALGKRAEGMKVQEITIVKDGDGNILRQEIKQKDIPPDTAAASLWLRNRQPKRWRDRVELTGDDGGPIQHDVHVHSYAEALASRLLRGAPATGAEEAPEPSDTGG